MLFDCWESIYSRHGKFCSGQCDSNMDLNNISIIIFFHDFQIMKSSMSYFTILRSLNS